jgi:hypothetical protein
MMGDDATVERMAREEREELARSHGQHILDAATGAAPRRAEQDQSLIDAIGRATKAKGEDSDG